MKIDIKKLYMNNTPFAIIQYYESLTILKKETHKKYEILYIEEVKRKKEGEIQIITKVNCKVLNSEEVNFFRSIKDTLDLVMDNRNGKIWEFQQF